MYYYGRMESSIRCPRLLRSVSRGKGIDYFELVHNKPSAENRVEMLTIHVDCVLTEELTQIMTDKLKKKKVLPKKKKLLYFFIP